MRATRYQSICIPSFMAMHFDRTVCVLASRHVQHIHVVHWSATEQRRLKEKQGNGASTGHDASV